MLFLVCFALFSWTYVVFSSLENRLSWPLLTANYIFFSGVAQTGIVFSAIMRMAKAQWSRSFCKIGEVLTLSTFPGVIGIFFLIYFGGMDHLFNWVSSEGKAGEPLTLWHNRAIFFWKNVIPLFFFYLLSFVYFRANRKMDSEQREPDSNILAALVMIFYVIANTNRAWDFGMTLIPHWESSIFPIYYWIGNLLSGSAFLFLLSGYFSSGSHHPERDKKSRDSMGKLLLGFTLLWIYMFWSQAIRIWYGNLSHLTHPLIERMSGPFGTIFVLMMIFVALIPFFGLIFRRIKLSFWGLSVIALISCAGIWLNCFLIVIPEFSNGQNLALLIRAGLNLAIWGLAYIFLSMILFLKWFPEIHLTPHAFLTAADK